ncbi:hypothetical protein SLEP1_g4925 [Rubroshorea leprosula]|uniref:MORF/ORRM1/DAG-like MORF domain-containing protein n=1 Tax=Rubroshorea leprosula TaxID=152421 RepID=A0AAV5I024_9ROSI|nr:hypothetical protein SLEP1_g4925 [Rubroshorea leprosula]
MANNTVSRFLLSKPKTLAYLVSSTRSFSTSSSSSVSSLCRTPSLSSPSLSLLYRLRPLAAASFAQRLGGPAVRSLSTRATSSSLNDPNPNWSNRPPKETILLDGCDFEHWLVVMEKPEGDPTRDEIIDGYIKTLAQVVGSEEEARMKIYSVSTRCYYAFGALVSEELSYKIKELPRVRWVLPDSYLDVKNKDYGGEPFIDGKAVPYDPKYHEEWIRNNARANERNRRNDRPRNSDRSRNFDRRRENMQNRDFQNRGMPPAPNQSMQTAPNTGGMPPSMNPNNMGGMQPDNYAPRPPMPPNQGWSGNMQNFQNNPNQGAVPNYQNNYSPNSYNQGGIPNQGAAPNYQNNYSSNVPNQGVFKLVLGKSDLKVQSFPSAISS